MTSTASTTVAAKTRRTRRWRVMEVPFRPSRARAQRRGEARGSARAGREVTRGLKALENHDHHEDVESQAQPVMGEKGDETVEPIETDAQQEGPGMSANRASAEQHDAAYQGRVEEERGRPAAARPSGQRVDDLGHAKPDDESPVLPGEGQGRVDERQRSDPVEPERASPALRLELLLLGARGRGRHGRGGGGWRCGRRRRNAGDESNGGRGRAHARGPRRYRRPAGSGPLERAGSVCPGAYGGFKGLHVRTSVTAGDNPVQSGGLSDPVPGVLAVGGKPCAMGRRLDVCPNNCHALASRNVPLRAPASPAQFSDRSPRTAGLHHTARLARGGPSLRPCCGSYCARDVLRLALRRGEASEGGRSPPPSYLDPALETRIEQIA